MLPIRDGTRRVCSVLALASLAAGIASMPRNARSAASVPGAPVIGIPLTPPRDPVPVLIRRNPFVGGSVPASSPSSLPGMGTLSRTDFVPAGATSLPTVTAIAVGERPTAVVQQDGTSRIHTVGDHVAGHVIVSISLDGVRLDDGRLLGIGAAARPGPADSADFYPRSQLGVHALPALRGDHP